MLPVVAVIDNSAAINDETIGKIVGGNDVVVIAITSSDDIAMARAEKAAKAARDANLLSLAVIAPNLNITKQTAEKIVCEWGLDAIVQSGCGIAGTVRSIQDLLADDEAFISFCFADLKEVMSDAGLSSLSVGKAIGEGSIIAAIRQAVDNSRLGGSFQLARDIVFKVRAPVARLNLPDIHEAEQFIAQAVNPRANIIFGARADETLGDTIEITLFAGDFAEVTEQLPAMRGRIWCIDDN